MSVNSKFNMDVLSSITICSDFHCRTIVNCHHLPRLLVNMYWAHVDLKILLHWTNFGFKPEVSSSSASASHSRDMGENQRWNGDPPPPPWRTSVHKVCMQHFWIFWSPLWACLLIYTIKFMQPPKLCQLFHDALPLRCIHTCHLIPYSGHVGRASAAFAKRAAIFICSSRHLHLF